MENRASLTAQGIAIMRAVESARPAGERLFDDPYARLFVNPWLMRLSAFFLRTGYAERRGPGVQGYLLARTRYIDDFLLASVRGGIEQLVILGAGYDARAYRFADTLRAARIRVFEVDHPATQEVKLAKLQAIMGKLPNNVTFTPIDFNRQSLDERLAASGYDATRQTAFIWEGVTMYLAAPAVDDTLAFIARHSARGSSVVFDYVHRSVIEGRVRRGEAAGMRRYRRFTGEDLVFGIPEGAVTEFLAQRGFCDVRDTTSHDLERLYFGAGPHKGRRVAPVYAIASGVVTGP
jgi:methyltransferase (TIGR00027 family)